MAGTRKSQERPGYNESDFRELWAYPPGRGAKEISSEVAPRETYPLKPAQEEGLETGKIIHLGILNRRSQMYERNGVKYPRCTEIISDCTNKSGGLIQWSANQVVEWIQENCERSQCDACGYIEKPYTIRVDNDELNQARFAYKDTSDIAKGVGSKVHATIEAYLKREIARNIDGEAHFDLTNSTYTKLNRQGMHSFYAFNSWYKENDVKPLALEQTVWGDRWAGTLDMVCMLNGKKYIVDFKTSKKFYLTEHGCQIAAYRSCIPDAEGNGILRLDKETGLPEWKDFSKRYERDLAVWEAMVSLYFLKHPRVAARFNKKA